MSRLASRIAALEAKHRTAKAEDDRIIGILNYCDSFGLPKWDGVHRPGQQVIGVIGGTRIPPDQWEQRCLAQQQELTEELARLSQELEAGAADDGKTPTVGMSDQLAPGAKPKSYRYFTDADGIEWQLEIATNQKWRV